MILTNLQVLNLFGSLKQIKTGDYNLPIVISFSLAKALAILQPLMSTIQEEQYKIYHKHGTEENGQLIIPRNAMMFFQEDLNTFNKIENEVDIKKISLTDFPSDLQIPLSIMEGLMPMIAEE